MISSEKVSFACLIFTNTQSLLFFLLQQSKVPKNLIFQCFICVFHVTVDAVLVLFWNKPVDLENSYSALSLSCNFVNKCKSVDNIQL